MQLTKTFHTTLLFIKYITPLFAFLYMVVWVVQIFDEKLFGFLNILFGLLPRMLSSIIDITTEIRGVEVQMSYVYVAGIFVAIFLISSKIASILEHKIRVWQIEENRKNRLKKTDIKTEILKDAIDKEVIDESTSLEAYLYGLFEFKFKIDEKDMDEIIIQLAKQFVKMLSEKLKEKYPSIKFVIFDKMFFVANNLYYFEEINKDISKLCKVFKKISLEKNIKMDVLLSYVAFDAYKDPKQVMSKLREINKFGVTNKIIVSEAIYKRCAGNSKINLSFSPLGVYKILDNKTNNDIDINLYYVER